MGKNELTIKSDTPTWQQCTSRVVEFEKNDFTRTPHTDQCIIATLTGSPFAPAFYVPQEITRLSYTKIDDKS